MSAELSTQVVIPIIFGLLQVLIGLVTIWQLRDRRQPNSEYAMSSVKAEYWLDDRRRMSSLTVWKPTCYTTRESDQQGRVGTYDTKTIPYKSTALAECFIPPRLCSLRTTRCLDNLLQYEILMALEPTSIWIQPLNFTQYMVLP